MKKSVFRWFAITAAVLSLTACKLDDDSFDPSIMYPSAVVTVKPNADNTSFRMQLDETTVLNAVNMKRSPFGDKEVRALVNYRMPTEQELNEGRVYADVGNVYVNWIDSILTKNPVPDLGEDANAATYGNDPLEIVGSWTTVVEDGYITLRFRTLWSDGIMHRINLVASTDPEDPYKVTLYHDAAGDHLGSEGDAMVAFRLTGLPDTQGEAVDLTLEWNSFSGKKTAKFKYCTRNYSAGPCL